MTTPPQSGDTGAACSGALAGVVSLVANGPGNRYLVERIQIERPMRDQFKRVFAP
jgi:hypothetical protein